MISLLDLCYETLINEEINPSFLSFIFGEEYHLRRLIKERKKEVSLICGKNVTNILIEKEESFPSCFARKRIVATYRRKNFAVSASIQIMKSIREGFVNIDSYDVCCMEYMHFCLKIKKPNVLCLNCNRNTSEMGIVRI